MAIFTSMHLKNNIGLTLIEILIALAILSIAFMTILKVTATTIEQTSYLSDRTLATWVGVNIIREMQTNLRKISLQASETNEVEMGNRRWQLHATLNETPNTHIQKIKITVFSIEHPHFILSTISGFYETQK